MCLPEFFQCNKPSGQCPGRPHLPLTLPLAPPLSLRPCTQEKFKQMLQFSALPTCRSVQREREVERRKNLVHYQRLTAISVKRLPCVLVYVCLCVSVCVHLINIRLQAVAAALIPIHMHPHTHTHTHFIVANIQIGN